MTFLKNMMLVSIIILIFSSLLVKDSFGFTNGNNDSDVLKNVMESSGIAIQTVELNYSGFIAKKNIREIDQFKERIDKTFSISMEAPEKTCCSAVKVQFNGERKLSSFATLTIKMVGRQESVGSNTLSTYLMLKISINKQGKNQINQYSHYLQKSLKALNIEPAITTSIKGIMKKKMDHNEQLAFLKAMIQNLGGKVTEGLNEDKVISLSGFTEKLTQYIISKDKKVNVQIASRYDSVNQQTVITIGNPIINMSY